MKLNLPKNSFQPDPYVIYEKGKYYMYATSIEGVQLYSSINMMDWEYEGIVFNMDGFKEYWAPCAIKYKGKFYIYVSCFESNIDDVHQGRILVAEANEVKGPYKFIKFILPPFSIDPHVVLSGDDLYIFYSINDYDALRAGTLIVVDKMISPSEVEGKPHIVVRATLDEEIFLRNRFKLGQHWHTLEGAFYFRKGDYHYLMYSGNCYQSEFYYVGYAVAKGNTNDLTKLEFHKFPDENTYSPLIRKNEFEEGTGHNSLLEKDGHYYVFYHGRDISKDKNIDERRTARLLEINVDKEILTIIKR